MSVFSSIRTLLFFVFRRSSSEREMEEEFRSHLRNRADDLERSGLSREEAERQARVEFGSYQRYKEECREALGTRLLGELIADVRFGLRQLRRNPGFTAVAIITLALGIGANTAIFSVVNAVLLHPLPFGRPDQLVMLWQRTPHRGINQFTTPNFLAWKDQKLAFLRMAAETYGEVTLGEQGKLERAINGSVSADFFSVLDAKPVLGRSFLPSEDESGGRRVVVLSYGLWRRQYAGHQNMIGQAVTIGGEPFTVIGIMPRSFRDPINKRAELWTALWVNPSFESTRDNRGVHWLLVIGRLKAGISLEHARAAMDTVARHLREEYPQTDAGLGVMIASLNEWIVGAVRPALLILLAAVGLVLLIACANVANLQLARAAARKREMAVRTALGAERKRLFRQLLTESILLSLLGGGLGLLVAFWGLDLLRSLNPGNIPRLRAVSIDTRVFAFTLILSIVTGIIFGLVPALGASKADLNESLKKGEGRATAGLRGQRLRGSLVISEIALALVLLVGAGLMIRSFQSLQRIEFGFNPHDLLTMKLAFSAPKSSVQKTPQFYEQALEKVRNLAGVESAALARDPPLDGVNPSNPFQIAGRPPAEPLKEPVARYRVISPGYFRTLDIPVLQGRDFTAQDAQGSNGVVIINQTMARHFWLHQDPIGKQIKPKFGQDHWCTIVGVVGNVKHYETDPGSDSVMYYPYLQVSNAAIPLVEEYMTLVIKTSLPPSRLLPAIRRTIGGIDKGVPIYHIETMEDALSDAASQPRFSMVSMGIFGFVALLIAVAGIYGVMSYSVAQRTHEIGIRIALGAQKSDVLWFVIGQGMTLALIGVGIGVAGALGLTRFLSSLLYGVRPTDPLTFVVVSMILTGVALLACYVPARRATKVDPMVALRYE